MAHFNAILIGGPPHSGKSVLTHSLTQALRVPPVDHYVLRACPDGEGDWSNEAPPETVQLIRQKGQFTTKFVEQVVRDLNQRHLPLLVDVGGKPQPDQEVIFAQCTHAILIAQDEAGLVAWRPLVERNGLSTIAELLSRREGEDRLIENGPVLRAHLTGLERHCQLRGAVFDAVVACAAAYLREPEAVLSHHNLSLAPTELAVDLPVLAQQLGAAGKWTPDLLPKLLDYLPADADLSLYGRGPNWLFAAVAAHTQREAFYQFDARLGWVKPVRVVVGAAPGDWLGLTVEQRPGFQLLKMELPRYYLDYAACAQTGAPTADPDQGLVLWGKAPHWLLTGMARAYRQQPWLAVFQPQLQQAVVVAARTPGVAIGDLIPMEQADLAKTQVEQPAAC
jgi:CRISPR-associated protein Csx3